MAFAGASGDLDGFEFNKFCKDSKLIGHGFKFTDVDTVFAVQVKRHGKRRLDFPMFKDACRNIALKRATNAREVQGLVANSAGPIISATKAEYSKFHDDKSTYTGAHSKNEKVIPKQAMQQARSLPSLAANQQQPQPQLQQPRQALPSLPKEDKQLSLMKQTEINCAKIQWGAHTQV